MANTMDVDAEIQENERDIEALSKINRRLAELLTYVDRVGNSLDALSLTASRYLSKRRSMLIKKPEDANTQKEPDTECVDGSDVEKMIDNKDLSEA